MNLKSPQLLLITASCLIVSCIKEEQKPKTTAEKILGKWQLDKFVSHSVHGEIDQGDSLIGTASDYLDFRTDGKLYVNIYNRADTVLYSVISDTTLTIGNENESTYPSTPTTYKIRSLAGNTFSYYDRRGTSNNPPHYSENAFYLKR